MYKCTKLTPCGVSIEVVPVLLMEVVGVFEGFLGLLEDVPVILKELLGNERLCSP